MRVENSFVPVRGVGEKTEKRLWRDGVTDWACFEERGREVLNGRRGDRVVSYIDKARDALDAGDAAFFGKTLPDGEIWRMYRNFDDKACFFDIETTGLSPERNVVTTASFHIDGETTTLVRGDDLTSGNVRGILGDASLVVSYNGKRFDAPFVETNLGVEFDLPHVDLMYPCRRVGLTGGLKTVEKTLGVGRKEEVDDVDGREAVRLWHAYEDGDTDALERLIEYNRYDAENLRAVLDAVHDRLHDEVFETACGGSS